MSDMMVCKISSLATTSINKNVIGYMKGNCSTLEGDKSCYTMRILIHDTTLQFVEGIAKLQDGLIMVYSSEREFYTKEKYCVSFNSKWCNVTEIEHELIRSDGKKEKENENA